MTIKSSAAAVIAVFSVALFFAPSANAQEKPETKKDDKQPVVVEIKGGDTLSSIADAHSTTYIRIFNANEAIANPDVINEGDKVRIPTAGEELPDRYSELSAQQVAAQAAAQQAVAAATQPQAAASAPAAQPSAAPRAYTASTAGNTYYSGYCTWYAKDRRPDLPNMLGNGGEWVANAAARGYATGSTPRAGAIAEIPGHVMYVESVNNDGTIVISEMNGPAGFGVIGTRTIAANSAQYIY